MPQRFFTEDIGGSEARLRGEDARHLSRVLRAKAGDVLTLCDGRGSDYEAEITSVADDAVAFRILSRQKSAAEPTLWAEVYIGVARGERMDYAVQKSVELGASRIVPFVSARTVAVPKNPAAKAQRWQKIAHEAAKQCGRGLLPQVAQPLPFSAALAMAAKAPRCLFCYEEGGISLREAFAGAGRVAVITGPEGGFEAHEAAAAADAGCLTVGLGPRILRCETAPAAVLAALMALSGNLESPPAALLQRPTAGKIT